MNPSTFLPDTLDLDELALATTVISPRSLDQRELVYEPPISGAGMGPSPWDDLDEPEEPARRTPVPEPRSISIPARVLADLTHEEWKVVRDQLRALDWL